MSGYFTKELDGDIVDGISDQDIVVASMPKSNFEITHVADHKWANNVAILHCFLLPIWPFTFFEGEVISTNDIWNPFKFMVFYFMNTHIQTKIKSTMKRNPWITREIIHAKRKITSSLQK